MSTAVEAGHPGVRREHAMAPDDPRHGTNAGAVQHFLSNVPTCAPCRAAHAAHKRAARRRRAAERIDQFHIDSTGTQRRIRALLRMGYRYCDMDRWLGNRGATAHNLNRSDTRTVHVDTARKVARMYDALCMKPGPSERTRNLAAARGWPSPLAWDDDAIDDPNAKPVGLPTSEKRSAGVDQSAIERRILGDRTDRLHAGEAAEVVRRLLADGRSTYWIRNHTGLKPERYITRDKAAA